MPIVDLIVAGLAAAAAYRGWQRGFLGELFELGGGFVGLLLGIAFGPRVAAMFTQGPGFEGALISLLVVLVLFSIGQTSGHIIGHRFGRMAHNAHLGGVNAALGMGLGIVVTAVSFWVVGSLLTQGPSRPVARAVQRSSVLRAINAVFPEPPNVLAYLGQYLRTSGFPQVFAGLPRPIGPPVDLPSDADARRAIEAAGESTVRIEVPACGGTQLGSGWVAAEGVVVTNAHVVAGGETVTIQDQAGLHSATVVLFDPATDIAVLRSDGLIGRPLELETDVLERGTGGATLGYPGGGDLRPHRAAVQDSYPARGLDIYGRSSVTRDVYELRSPVRQGDSGGPFVLPNGDVAGLVFAASTTDGGTGYALTGAEVQDEVAAGIDRIRPVSTGSCTH